MLLGSQNGLKTEKKKVMCLSNCHVTIFAFKSQKYPYIYIYIKPDARLPSFSFWVALNFFFFFLFLNICRDILKRKISNKSCDRFFIHFDDFFFFLKKKKHIDLIKVEVKSTKLIQRRSIKL
jgi:hypothetical protein